MSDVDTDDPAQALIISFDFSTEFGLDEEKAAALDLEDSIIESIQDIQGSDVDGHEFGDNEFRMYIYAKEIDKVFEKVTPLLKDFLYKPVRYTLRYGSVHDKDAKEVKDRFF